MLVSDVPLSIAWEYEYVNIGIIKFVIEHGVDINANENPDFYNYNYINIH